MGTRVFKGVFEIEKNLISDGKIPILSIKDINRTRQPAILCSHGFLGNKESMLQTCLTFAEAGFIAIAWDARYHGERTQPNFWMDWYEDFPRVWMKLVIDSAHDISSIVDFLQRRNDVLSSKIGMMGVSMGGFISVLAAMFDKRLKSIVSIIGGANYGALFAKTEFGKSVPLRKTPLRRLHSDTRSLIEDYEPLNSPERMFPTAVLLLNGDLDTIVPLECGESLYQSLEPYYKGAPERLAFKVCENTYHEFTPEMNKETIKWFGATLQ